jgi:uncharacterized protein YndB with AHSA1/START domain
MDFRVGGTYLNALQDADGRRIWSTGIYKEITPFRKIVFTDSFADPDGNVVAPVYYGIQNFPPELEVTVTFQAVGSKTKMKLRHTGLGVMDEAIRNMMEAGWHDACNQLKRMG